MILGLLVCKKNGIFENKVIFFISILYILIRYFYQWSYLSVNVKTTCCRKANIVSSKLIKRIFI